MSGRLSLATILRAHMHWSMLVCLHLHTAVHCPCAPLQHVRAARRRSTDGARWELVTPAAPWPAREGLQKLTALYGADDTIVLTAGEAGYFGPYFNDVWYRPGFAPSGFAVH